LLVRHLTQGLSEHTAPIVFLGRTVPTIVAYCTHVSVITNNDSRGQGCTARAEGQERSYLDLLERQLSREGEATGIG
jgi:hypothetical protein